MKRWLVLSLVVLWWVFFFSHHGSRIVRGQEVAAAGIQSYTTPLYFIPNSGQVHQEALFYAKTSRYTLWMTKEGLVFDGVRKAETKIERDVSRLVFLGTHHNPEIVPVDITAHQVNYFKGKSPSQWFTGLHTSKAVLYKNLYNGIDVKVYGVEKQIEYDWIVKPGAHPAQIRFHYQDVKATRINEKGDLIIETSLGELTHKRPVSWQMIGKERKNVEVTFKKIGKNTYGFEVSKYDKNFELIIDPVVLVYSTYLGGSNDDYGVGLAVDSSGCAYVTGDAYSPDFPTKAGGYQTTYAGGEADAYVTKFSASGKSLVYSTFIGGSDDDETEGILVDSSGQAYLIGITASSDFPTQGACQATYGGGTHDAFVAILSASGSSLVYSTFLGGSAADGGYAIALDSSKNIYITGLTHSTDFPTVNAYKGTFSGGGQNEYDAFVTKIAASGSSLVYSTYLGGNGIETGYGIAVEGSNAYVTGSTTSTNFPTKNEYQDSHGGGDYDGFVTKFSSAGNTLIYSTYLGGSQRDMAWGIDVNSSGNAYVTGTTYSTNFPTQDAYQSAHGGGDRDIFLTKFASTGTILDYSTFLGGAESEAGAHVLVDSAGSAYIIGYTSSTDFPLKRAYQTSYNGELDGMVAMFTAAGTLCFSTFIGGSDVDSGRGIALDSSGNIYISGYTESSDFPTENSYQSTLQGGKEAFLVKFSTSQFGTICGAVDNCDLTWTTGGDANWFEDVESNYYDGDAARSGDIGNSQSSYIQTTVTGPGELSFWWKVSSEYDDRLKFYIDGTQEAYTYGTAGAWHHMTFSIASGSHTLKWSYEKDSSWSYGSDCGWVDKVEYNPETSIALDRTQLTFGAVAGHTTGAQTFSISDTAGGSLNWTAISDQDWLSCSPGSGSGDGVVTVTVDATGLSSGSLATYTGAITVWAPYATNSPQTVTVTLYVYKSGLSSLPFGTYETPTDHSTIRSSVPFTGWVLDDLGVQSVKIYRQDGGSLNYIGDAILVEGARPDVEQAYPDYPFNYKAGWGYMMLTNFLPNGGNGTFTIAAIATDVEGHQVTLGTKTLTVDNASAVKPFGAIDTPPQGGPTSGAGYVNWGWVLTPQPNSIPTNGSTIDVWVDGVNLGHPTYNIYRADIAALFPGYVNSNGAAGYFHLDTTAYSNGVHTIQWTARDSGNNTDGIGSRYFIVQNSSQRSGQNAYHTTYGGMPAIYQPKFITPGQDLVFDTSTPVGIVKGYRTDVAPNELEMIYPDEQGMIMVDTKETERIELHLGCTGKISGWLKVGNQFRPLPPGSYLNPDTGIFCWQMGLAYLGQFHLVFVEEDQFGNSTAMNVIVNITSKY